MKLTAPEVARFYAIWKPLILFVNRRLRIVPEMLGDDFDGPWDPNKFVKIRDALWADNSLRKAFIAENPARLSNEDLALVESWANRRTGEFYIYRQLKRYAVFLQGETVYGVLGLSNSFAEVVPFMPIYVKTALLPFGDRIIYDSLLNSYNVLFGKGIRNDLDRTYKDAKERNAVITSLLPSEPASREKQEEDDRVTNEKVLEAFRTHLYRTGLSSKVVERDVANVATFAEGYLLGLPEPCSLREFGGDEVRGYIAQIHASPDLKDTQQRQAVTSLKRFVKFLLDTDGIDIDAADYYLDILKGRE